MRGLAANSIKFHGCNMKSYPDSRGPPRVVGGVLAWLTGSQAQAGKFQDGADRLERKDG